MFRTKGFTLLEILIVISILAILGVAVIPSLLNMDYKARITTTNQNLQAIRSAIETYYAMTGKFPTDQLVELHKAEFKVGGKTRTLLKSIPHELISTDQKLPADMNPRNCKVYNSLGSEGGWFYDVQKGDVYVNWNQQLPAEWGEGYAGQNPSKW